MLTLALEVAGWLLAAALVLAGWRLLRGPDVLDRVLALDTLYVNAAALLVVYGLRLGTGQYFEFALVIALLGFLSTIAFAKFLERGNVVE